MNATAEKIPAPTNAVRVGTGTKIHRAMTISGDVMIACGIGNNRGSVAHRCGKIEPGTQINASALCSKCFPQN